MFLYIVHSTGYSVLFIMIFFLPLSDGKVGEYMNGLKFGTSTMLKSNETVESDELCAFYIFCFSTNLSVHNESYVNRQFSRNVWDIVLLPECVHRTKWFCIEITQAQECFFRNNFSWFYRFWCTMIHLVTFGVNIQ